MTKPRTPSTAKSTKIPPCGARRLTSRPIDRAPVTALPAMIDGITRSGSAAANGMAPSVMNEAPIAQAALPFSRSGTVNSPGRTTVARASASGGTMPASMTAAITLSSGASVAVAAAPRPVVAKAYAVLLSGPPMSKAIIRPRITPRMIAEPPCRLLRPSLSASIRPPSGLPRTTTMTKPLISVASSGITSTGIRPRIQVGTFQRVIQCATMPARTPPTMPPRKPELMRAGDGAHDEARRDAGAVGDGVGDVAGQRRDQEAERRGAEGEEQRTEVGEERAAEQRVARGRARRGRAG